MRLSHYLCHEKHRICLLMKAFNHPLGVPEWYWRYWELQRVAEGATVHVESPKLVCLKRRAYIGRLAGRVAVSRDSGSVQDMSPTPWTQTTTSRPLRRNTVFGRGRGAKWAIPRTWTVQLAKRSGLEASDAVGEEVEESAGNRSPSASTDGRRQTPGSGLGCGRSTRRSTLCDERCLWAGRAVSDSPRSPPSGWPCLTSLPSVRP